MFTTMRLMFIVVLAAVSVSADLPVECYFSDIAGHWVFHETARTGMPGLNCDREFKDSEFIHKKSISLRFPNTAEDEFGNIGTWTMIYDQGFEVQVGGRSYFAFSYFTQDSGNTTSFCNRTLPGWSRDLTVRNWSCYKAVKKTPVPPRIKKNQNNLHLLGQRFIQNQKYIDAINKVQKNWEATYYPQFEGRDLHSIHRMRGAQRKRSRDAMPPKTSTKLESRLRASMLPKSWDWRNVSGVNYVRPVKDQGSCGSCYAFASIGAIESQLQIRSGASEQLDLSAEDIVGCSTLSQGCDGGFPYLIAGRYAQDMGMVSEKCVPYTIKETCNRNRDHCRHIYTTEYGYVGGYFGACNEEEMKIALVEKGPLAVGIEVYDDFMNYRKGIYHHTGISNSFNPLEVTNHAVLLVGYGVTEEGEKYWIIQNSWGPEWGVNGYVYMRRGTDEVAVESLAVQAVAYP